MTIASRLKRSSASVITAAVLLICGSFGAGRLWSHQSGFKSGDLKLPSDLASYKQWKKMLESPKPVPLALWLQCIAPTPADWSKAKEQYGPHSDHLIQVYANPSASQVLLTHKEATFPVGAIIAKEKLLFSETGPVVGVAFMTKRGGDEFASTGGWEFSYYPRSDDAASIQECGNCHRSVGSRDYVFGPYPAEGSPLSTKTPSQ
jgi:hypothetical protein